MRCFGELFALRPHGLDAIKNAIVTTPRPRTTRRATTARPADFSVLSAICHQVGVLQRLSGDNIVLNIELNTASRPLARSRENAACPRNVPTPKPVAFEHGVHSNPNRVAHQHNDRMSDTDVRTLNRIQTPCKFLELLPHPGFAKGTRSVIMNVVLALHGDGQSRFSRAS